MQSNAAGRHSVFLQGHCSLTFLPDHSAVHYHMVCHSAPYFSTMSLCSIQSGASLYSSDQEVYSIAYVSVKWLCNAADFFSVAYELVDNWYQLIIGFIRYKECSSEG